MHLLRPVSIRRKLTLIVMITTCVALLISLTTLAVVDELNFRDRMRREGVATAEIVANYTTAALSFGDTEPAKEILKALATDSHLVTAIIRDADGAEFASYQRPWAKLPAPHVHPEQSATFREGYLEVTMPVTLNHRTLGFVVLQRDLGELGARRKRAALNSLAVLLAAAGVGYLLAMRLQKLVSKPILELSQISRTVAAEKNYKVRVTKESNDEVGQLIDGFNEMLSQIETRDSALLEAQLALEARVQERTSELFNANELLKTEVGGHKKAREESDALRIKLQTANERLEREAEERSAVQEALRRSEERFSKAFRTSPVPLAILTRSSQAFVDVNDRFAALADRKREDIIGSTLFSLPLWSAPETRARIEQLLTDGQPIHNWQCSVNGPEEQPRTAMLSAESFMLGSEPCVLLMTEDISERVNLEGQLRQAQKMEAIGQLASGVAHDFNNLLTIIQGYTQLVLSMQPAGAGMVRDALEKVTGASQRAAQLTGQLLTFSRRQVAQPKALNLNDVVGNVTGMLRPLLGEHVKLCWQPAMILPAIEGDAGMLEQVLVNLAVNSRDAMPRGGDLIISTFTCDIDKSYLHCRPQATEGRFVCLQVSDSGCGMDPLTLERIFEPFFTTKGVGKGTGLGLATVYGIVKQHRGWIEVTSQLGMGTVFKIFLPATQTSSSPSEKHGDAGVDRGGNETILVVEDEPALRELMSRILRTLGYNVIESQNGKEALALWETLPVKPSLLLTDMMMPEGMTGWELAERLRTEVKDLKVVYISGYSPELFGGNMKLHNRANFLPKPFHPRILSRTVRQCLDN